MAGMTASADNRLYTVAEQLSPLICRVLARNPSPFTYTGTQTYIVGTERNVAVIDPGPAEEEHLAALMRALEGTSVAAICCTHTHRDHSPAAAALSQLTGAQIVGCSPLNLVDDGPRADASFDPTYQPDAVMKDGDRIVGDGWELTAIATPGHASNHLCYALNGGEALFSGDHVMGWSTTVVSPPDGDMTDYMASLQKLYDRQDLAYYPAHGPRIDKPQQFVRSMIGHRRQREGQIVKLLEQGDSRIEQMVPQMYKAVDKGLWPAAGRSVHAHLIDLERKGRVVRSGEEWSIA